MKTTTRTWLHALVLGVLLLRVNASEKPNILFILVDDMGWSDIGCYGGEIETPHIDSLSKQGVRFTQFYNTAKCMSSRGCLLTGLYAQQCGMSRRPDKLINAVTLGEVLRTAGYRTWAAGKHHGTENLYDRGFDHYYGLRDGCCNLWNPGVKRLGEPEPGSRGAGAECATGATTPISTTRSPQRIKSSTSPTPSPTKHSDGSMRSRLKINHFSSTSPSQPRTTRSTRGRRILPSIKASTTAVMNRSAKLATNGWSRWA